MVAPLVEKTPGLYQVLTAANTDYPVVIPAGAKGLILWFETSASDPSLTGGKVAFAANATALTPAANDSSMGYQSAQAYQYSLQVVGSFAVGRRLVTHVHLASQVAGVIARGQWLFGDVN